MLRALVTIGAAQVMTMLVLLGRTKALALMLGPENLGVMAVIDKLLAVIAQTVSLSLPFAAARFLPGRWMQGPAAFRALFTRMRDVLLTLTLVATLVSLVISWLQPAFWGAALLPYRAVLTVALVGIPVTALIPFLQNAVAGRMQQNRSMVITFLYALVMTLSVAGIALFGLVGYYLAFAALGATLLVIASRFATEDTSVGGAALAAERMYVGLPLGIWRFSGALLILTFVAPYAALFIHYRLLSQHGNQAAGWMQSAIGVSLAVRQVLGAAHAVYLTPNVNRGGSPAARMEWANRFQITLCLLAGLTVPPLLMFPGLALRLLYTTAFSPAAAFVVLFVLAEMVGMLSGTYQSLIIALDHLPFHVISNMVAQMLVVGIAFAAVGPLGILGAGLASLAAPIFLYAATMLFLSQKHRLRMPRAVVTRSAWLLISLLATGILGARFPDLNLAMLPVKAAIYALVVAGFAVLLTTDERQRVRDVTEGLRARWA